VNRPTQPAPPTYRERLHVPGVWWVTPIFFVLVFVAGAYRYLGVPAAWVTLALCVTVVVVGLRRYGQLELIVDADGFGAGPARLARSVLGPAAPLDAAQARALRGTRADARARLVLRGYIATAVRVDVADPTDPTPYWYVSTRHPHALVTALNELRTRGPGS